MASAGVQQDVIQLSEPAQFKALGHPLRHTLLGVLNQRPATISQLADALGTLKGNVSHHIKVLEDAGLVRVVRTRRVRGATERYYARSARRLDLAAGADADPHTLLLRLATEEVAAPEPDEPGLLRYLRTRIPAARLPAFVEHVERFATELGETLEHADAPGEPVYALLVGLYRTGVPTLPEEPA
jgi:DNA-binding transcriptional ArsR family regulator